MSSEWETIPLGDLASKRTDFTPVAAEYDYDVVGVKRSGWGLVRREPIRGDSMKFSKLMRLEKGNLIYRTITAFEAPSTVVPSDFDGAFVTPQTFPVFRLNASKVLPGFMSLLTTFPKFQEAMSERCTGTVLRRKTLAVGAFLSIPISLPSLNEQQRIVDLIFSVDEAIQVAEEALRAVVGLLRSRREYAMHEGPESRSAGDVFEITMGRQRSPQHASGNDMIPYLRSANVLDGQLDMTDINSMNFTPGEQEKYCLEVGDVLVTEGSASQEAVGASALWNGELSGPVGFQNTLLRFRSVPGVTTSGFVFHWCRWAYESGAFREAANGTSILHIGSKRAEKMRVQLPDLLKQEEIVGELDAFESVVSLRRDKVDSLRMVRVELLSALLSGAHRIPETYDELMGA